MEGGCLRGTRAWRQSSSCDPLLGVASLAESLVNGPEGCQGLMQYVVLPWRTHS